MSRSNFAITGHRGFHMTFENGWTVSVQFGPGNYGDHHGDWDYEAPQRATSWESTRAEAWAWKEAGREEAEGVKPYLTANEVLAYINEVAKR